ncbi:hypothetical protein JW949_03150 [Candidatus Woesearchaeota archaeon]|nr:hypothetical protein [Candidatus Woesearchaeota archaeon]
MKTIKEGNASVKIPESDKISRKMGVFYNPKMESNRDISVLLLKTMKKENMNIGLPLAGTGIRGIRFLTELPRKKIKSIKFNDHSEKAVNLIKKNIELNEDKLKCADIEVSCLDSDEFLLKSGGFDYIEIDPFGSPNRFIDMAVKRTANKGIIAVTATDTAPLSGTYPKTCLRKYWAIPLRNEIQHLIGLRILIRKIQLIGAQYNKSLTPVLSYYKDHYLRVFFECRKSRKECNKLLKNHDFIFYFNEKTGPLWLGKLNDEKILKKMLRNTEKNNDFLKTLYDETRINNIIFYPIHELAKELKIKNTPKNETIIKELKKKKYKASLTHFTPCGIKTDMEIDEFLDFFKELSNK